MFRITIMVQLAGGGIDHGSHAEGTDQSQLYPLLSTARAELQTTLQDIGEAVQAGHIGNDYHVCDQFLHDTQTGRFYDVAWERAELG
jgi:hypothetical protein